MKAQLVAGTLIPWDEELSETLKKLEDQAVVDIEIIKPKKRRTSQQNRAIHKYCDLVALSFNAAGITHKLSLPNGVEIETDWAMPSVKTGIWHPIQASLFETTSTADLEPAQVSKVYEIINRDVTLPLKIHIPFPNWKDLAT